MRSGNIYNQTYAIPASSLHVADVLHEVTGSKFPDLCLDMVGSILDEDADSWYSGVRGLPPDTC